MATEVMINLLVKIALLTACGFFLKKRNIMTQSVKEGLNTLLVKALLPMSIIMSSQNDYSKEAAKSMVIVAIVSIGYYMVALLFATVLSKACKLSDKGKSIFVTMIVFANVGFIGFPIAGELYGAQGTLYTVVYNICYQLVFFTYGISLISGERQIKLKMLYTNPVTIASFVSVVFFLAQIKIQTGIASACSSLAGMTVPVSMMLIGASLSETKLSEVLKDKYSYLVTSIRMVVLPVIMLFVLKKIGLSMPITGTCAVLTALPAGSLNVIYAEQYNCEPLFASRTVVQTMLCMVITIPLLLMIIQTLG